MWPPDPLVLRTVRALLCLGGIQGSQLAEYLRGE